MLKLMDRKYLHFYAQKWIEMDRKYLHFYAQKIIFI